MNNEEIELSVFAVGEFQAETSRVLDLHQETISTLMSRVIKPVVFGRSCRTRREAWAEGNAWIHEGSVPCMFTGQF